MDKQISILLEPIPSKIQPPLNVIFETNVVIELF